MDLTRFVAPFNPPTSTLVDCLRYWTEIQPDELCYAFTDGEESETKLTYRQFDRRARAVAAKLTQMGMRGERALLLYHPGLEFITSYFGCMYAGVVAVPAYPPRRNRNTLRIQAISVDAQARVALTDADTRIRSLALADEAPQLTQLDWLATDELDLSLADSFDPQPLDPHSLAMLQYTSGSTGVPKGVMLTHQNLIFNTQLITYSFEPTRDCIGMSWLPTYHDMGLVGGVLKAMFYGRPCVLMSPMSFMTKPARWLRGISKYRVSISGGPNFAYDLCVDKITDAEIAGIDLSCWVTAFNGAEPIRAQTLERFTKRFAPYGFRAGTHYACYGMAETTLIVTGSQHGHGPVVSNYNGRALDNKRIEPCGPNDEGARAIVGCGRVLPEEEVLIVDPETLTESAPGHIGEIWVQSPSVAIGYWGNQEATDATFHAYLSDSKRGPFLRTGDLGFLEEGELFVTGRLKDLIIVRGVNRYPQDIEATVESASARIASGSVAAFGVEYAGRERLIVIAEAERARRDNWSDVIQAIRSEVTAQHELPPDAVILVRFGSMPMTSSGKIQRHASREEFLAGKLNIIAQWREWEEGTSVAATSGAKEPTMSSPVPIPEEGVAEPVKGPEAPTEIIDSVMDHIRAVAKERSKGLNTETNILTDLGLDSLERMQIANSLEETYGGRFPDHVLSEIETVREVAAAIVKYVGSEPKVARKVVSPLASPNGSHGVNGTSTSHATELPAAYYKFSEFPEYKRLKAAQTMLLSTGVPNPYFRQQERVVRDTVRIRGRELISFTAFNYIGMSGDPAVMQAAKDAVDNFGTSVSASRLVSGETTLHAELERELAELVGAEDVITMVSGHGTNESIIGHLFGPGDLIAHDSLAHNSIIQGAILSGARRRPFPHNDCDALEELLDEVRGEYRRVLIAVEGVYSMDGDYADLPRLIEIKKKHKAFLFIDEAHSLGTMGATGRGLGEMYDVNRSDVDLWMGTISKSLGSCGGYLGACKEVIEYLRYTTPAFVFATGLSPSAVGAALEAIHVLKREPQRVHQLQENSRLFLSLAKERGLNTGLSGGTPVVPIVLGNSLHSLQISAALFEKGINVQPILHPAVEEEKARLRFFINSTHTAEQIRYTVDTMADELAKIDPKYVAGVAVGA